jgi:hypothetical protein
MHYIDVTVYLKNGDTLTWEEEFDPGKRTKEEIMNSINRYIEEQFGGYKDRILLEYHEP